MRVLKTKSKSNITKSVPKKIKGFILAGRALLEDKSYLLDGSQSSSKEKKSTNVDGCEKDSTLDESVITNFNLHKINPKSGTIVPVSAAHASPETMNTTVLEIESLCSDEPEDRTAGVPDFNSMVEGDEETQLPESCVNELCDSLQSNDCPISPISSIISLNELEDGLIEIIGKDVCEMNDNAEELNGKDVPEKNDKAEIEERSELLVVNNVEAEQCTPSDPLDDVKHEYWGRLLTESELASYWQFDSNDQLDMWAL